MDFGSEARSQKAEVRNTNSASRTPVRMAAAIDVGTNTVRLLIGEAKGRDGYRPLFAAQEITRLGEGLLPDRQLQPVPMDRTLAVLARYRDAAMREGAEVIRALGTSALREARNRDIFLRRALDEAGLRVQVISGEEEARLTLRGVLGGLPERPPRLLLMDIGGGSTEFLAVEDDRIVGLVSTGLGVVKLTEAHFRHDPPLPAELAAAREAVALRLQRVRSQELPRGELPGMLVGTAGTITTLAAIDLALVRYDPDRITGHVLSRARIADLVRMLAGQPLATRRAVPGLEPARADVIVAGGVICLVSMEALGVAALTVSDAGLREGILLGALSGRPEDLPPEVPGGGRDLPPHGP